MKIIITITAILIVVSTGAQVTNTKQEAKALKREMKADQAAFYIYKFAKQQIELQYEKMEEAQKNLDIDMMISLTHPAYMVTMPDGSIGDINWLRSYWTAGLQQVKSTEFMKNDIQQFKLKVDTAVVVVHQQWKRKQIKAGQLRNVQTEVVQTETWVKTGECWKRFRIENEHDQIFYVDNKRIDPSKPYDPNAPEFVPPK